MSHCDPRYWAVVPAAGAGRRMGSDTPKQYLTLNSRALIEHTLDKLLAIEAIEMVLVALAPDDADFADLPVAAHPRVQTVTGGADRAASVSRALEALTGRAREDDWVLVHDAARPCIRPADIRRLLNKTAQTDGGLLACPVSDTLKRAGSTGRAQATVDRSNLWGAQTPQVFRWGALREALAYCARERLPVTDEASAMEQLGVRPLLVEGRRDNIKVTRPEDRPLAEWILGAQTQEDSP